jgi:hypothetical protein
VCSYGEGMKAYLFSAALIVGIVATSACQAKERARPPAHAPEGAAVVNPTGHAGGDEAPSPGGGGVQAAPATAGEHSGAVGHDKGVSQGPKPGAETPAVSATHAHGPRQPVDRNSHNDNPRSPSPIDTHITVNQGRTGVNNNKGFVHKQEAPVDKGRRANPQSIHVPHSISRPAVVPGPTRNAIGVAPDANVGARRMSPTPFPGTGSARGPAGTKIDTYSPGIRPPGGAPGGGGLGSSTGGAHMGRPIGIPGSGSISGAGMAHGGPRVGEIGGPAKSNGGISGTSVRAKRP